MLGHKPHRHSGHVWLKSVATWSGAFGSTGSQGLGPTDSGGPLTTVQWCAVPGPSLEQNVHRRGSMTTL
eukprot:12251545-Alexandrium_andersonii.AAC.1